MRTTLTLDDDVAARLEQERRRRRSSFKDIVNDVLRASTAMLDAEANSISALVDTMVARAMLQRALGRTPEM